MRLILLSALILVGLGTTLYQVKTSIDERQDLLSSLELSIANTKRDIAVLEAEWAYISRPDRVMALSSDLLRWRRLARTGFYHLMPFRCALISILSSTPKLVKRAGKKRAWKPKQGNNSAKVVR